jgi:hypothetical protein
LEGIAKLPVGFHVCVVDPGVGTKRRGIAVQTKRGDFLIGPDNGLLMPAAEFLGGILQVFELVNERFRKHPVSPIFHGRDVFAPAAAYLAKGVKPEELGPKLNPKDLTPAPYPEAKWKNGKLDCEVIHINENGSLFLNVRAEEFKKQLKIGDQLEIQNVPYSARHSVVVPYCRTFGEVPVGKPLILDDDFGRVEVAVNQGSFALTFGVKRGQKLSLRTPKG